MAERDDIERTEAASPRLVAQARERGIWPRSGELVVACVLFAGVLTLRFAGGNVAIALAEMIRDSLGRRAIVESAGEPKSLIAGASAASFGWAVLLMAAPLTAAVVAWVAQVGLRLRPEVFVPDVNRLNPATGIARLISLAGLRAAAFGVAKWLVLAMLAAWWLWQAVTRVTSPAAGPDEWTAQLAGAVLDALTKLAVALVVVGLADYAAAWWRWLGEMRSSREEQRIEQRESEGDPQLRGRRRQRQSERAGSRVDKLLAADDVILIGKGRLAVALRRNPAGEWLIVAKSVGPAADRLQRAARSRNARVVRDDSLARAAFRSGQPGDSLAQDTTAAITDRLRLRAIAA